MAFFGILAAGLRVHDGIDEVPVVGLTRLDRNLFGLWTFWPRIACVPGQVFVAQALGKVLAAVELRFALLGLWNQCELAAFDLQCGLIAHNQDAARGKGVGLRDIDVDEKSFWIFEQTVHNVRYGAAVFPLENSALRDGRLRGLGAHELMHLGELVDEEIAGDTGRIVPPAAPPEELCGVEGTLGGFAEKARPVDCCHGGIGWNRIEPGTFGVVAMVAHADHVHFAERAGGDQLFGLGGEG